MAAGTTTTVQVDPEVNLFFDNILLDRHQPYYVYGYFAQERRIPQKNSKNAIFRRFDNLADALTPLTEGVTPNAEQVTKFDITATVQQYGKVVELSDDVIITVQDQTANEVADMLAQNMASTYDKIVRNMLVATSAQIDCLNGVNGNAITEVTTTDLEFAVDYVTENNGKKLSPNQEGTNAFGTAPVWAAYWMVISTDLRTDFKNLSNFLATADYPRQQSVLEAELGSCDEVRLVMTSEGYKDATVSPPVYSNMLFAANAYGRIMIDDQSMEMIIKPLDTLGGSKPTLIDLETLTFEDEGNRAEDYALAA
ncbi:MAG: N4-gp56 family major capsid protein [Candidatus Rhabdochlamydia sp.]